GESLLIEFENQPDDLAPPYHYHPGREETFTVLEGRLSLKVDGKEFELGVGESATAPKGTAHTFWNASSEVVRFTSQHRPAQDFETFITSLYDLDYDGKSSSKGTPNILQLMALFKVRMGEQFLAASPSFLQKIATTILGTIGILLGNPSTYVSKQHKKKS
ncbi:MAG: cupin domain-containing protein, partial [Campylobacteraceae bacterium]|nr:cupin domain-containing protein [Campylobacteraceae bacterium]